MCVREREKENRERERERELHKGKNDDPFPIDIMPSRLAFFFLSFSFYFFIFPLHSDHRYFPLTMPTMTRIMERGVARRFLFIVEKDPLKGKQPRLSYNRVVDLSSLFLTVTRTITF